MIRIISWNIGGAKYLELTPCEREIFSKNLNKELSQLAEQHKPHFFVLQEIVKYGEKDKPTDLLTELNGYYYDASIAIDTINQNHPTKWAKYFKPELKWEPNTYFAQGYGILWRKDIAHAAIWDFESRMGKDIPKEIVRLDTGLFVGSRDTEPRLAVVTHFTFDESTKPIDIFIVNLHLTTLRGEREGSPSIDGAASIIRQGQLTVVLNGIVSRYNEWIKTRNITNRHPAIWLLAGDMNCLPESAEINFLKKMNFIDLNPNKGDGTKGTSVPINKGTITLDYIFAGPSYYALDPYITTRSIQNNPLPFDHIKVSDHFPIRSDIPFANN